MLGGLDDPLGETVLGQLAIVAADGNPDAAAQDLVTDTQFWRRVLAGAGTIIYTDIATDGMMQGPNFTETEKMLGALRGQLIASGGGDASNDSNKEQTRGIVRSMEVKC